jgi:hypothetical protein
MNEAQELILIVESRGGRLTIEGEKLVIEPQSAALPLADSLRTYKPEIVALLQSRSEQEAESAPERDALGLWMLARCVYRDRCFGGVGALYLSLARWCAEHGRPAPESRRAFAAVLLAKGFTVTTDGLVVSLVLREDVLAHELFQNPPAKAEPAPKRTRRAAR